MNPRSPQEPEAAKAAADPLIALEAKLLPDSGTFLNCPILFRGGCRGISRSLVVAVNTKSASPDVAAGAVLLRFGATIAVDLWRRNVSGGAPACQRRGDYKAIVVGLAP